MNGIASFAIIATLVGAALGSITLVRSRSTIATRGLINGQDGTKQSSGIKVLRIFLVVILLYGAFVAWHFWPEVAKHDYDITIIIGLLIAMAAGMIVRVVANNHQNSRPLFDVTASQLIYPMLFSPIVFFPIWSLASGDHGGAFVFHAAFLNGYFWESAVSSARPMTGGQNQTEVDKAKLETAR